MKSITAQGYTPGPWNVDLSGPFTLDGDTVEIVALDPKDNNFVTRQVCTCLLDTTDWPDSKEAREDAANCRLIAAAPELLELLEVALSIIKDCDPETVRMVAPRIEAAIAKAKGNP